MILVVPNVLDGQRLGNGAVDGGMYARVGASLPAGVNRPNRQQAGFNTEVL